MKCPDCSLDIPKSDKCLLTCEGCRVILRRYRKDGKFSKWGLHSPIHTGSVEKYPPTPEGQDKDPSDRYIPPSPPKMFRKYPIVNLYGGVESYKFSNDSSFVKQIKSIPSPKGAPQ